MKITTTNSYLMLLETYRNYIVNLSDIEAKNSLINAIDIVTNEAKKEPEGSDEYSWFIDGKGWLNRVPADTAKAVEYIDAVLNKEITDMDVLSLDLEYYQNNEKEVSKINNGEEEIMFETISILNKARKQDKQISEDEIDKLMNRIDEPSFYSKHKRKIKIFGALAVLGIAVSGYCMLNNNVEVVDFE